MAEKETASEIDGGFFVSITEIDDEAAGTYEYEATEEEQATYTDATTEAAPNHSLTLSVSPHHTVIGRHSTKTMTHVCVTISACKLPDEETKRAPVDIIVALDVSVSMTGDKLALCKKTVGLLLHQMLPQDRFGLVTFADEASVEIPTEQLTTSNEAIALNQIKAIKTRGNTNISDAIRVAAQELGNIENPNEVRTIFLLTDGHANCGFTDSITDVTKGYLQCAKHSGDFPITVHCFGYGSDHDSKLLTDVSESTKGGTYCFVDQDASLVSAFGNALGGILSVVAQNVAIDLCIPPEAQPLGARIGAVHHENVIKREDGSKAVSLGDFYAEESRDVLFDVKLATPSDGETDIPILHANVSLSYTDPLEKSLVAEKSISCRVARPSNEEVSYADPRVTVQLLRIYCIRKMKEVNKMCSQSDFIGARKLISKCMKRVYEVSRNNHLSSHPLINHLIEDLEDVTLGISSYKNYTTFGTHTLQQTIQSHSLQRCNAATLDSTSAYRGTSTLKMMNKFGNE